MLALQRADAPRPADPYRLGLGVRFVSRLEAGVRRAWLDELIAADRAMQAAAAVYEATLRAPDAGERLINSAEWQAYSQAAELRDELRDAHWPELLALLEGRG